MNNSGVTGLDIAGNSFYGGQLTCGGSCTASLQVTNAGTGVGVHGNSWYSPGEYAGDFQVPVYLAHNYCTSPFSVAALPANDYDKACFRFASAAGRRTDRARQSDGFHDGCGGRYSWRRRLRRQQRKWLADGPLPDAYYNAGAGSFDSWNERIFITA